jgi:hypothetical protein
LKISKVWASDFGNGSGRGSFMNWHFIRRAKELYSWYSFAVGVGALLVAGVSLAVGGAVWLATAGIPLPLVVMAGFCTLVGAVYLAMAPLVYRVLRQTPIVTKPGEDQRPNYAAVRLQHQYSLDHACRLWVDLDPGAGTTYDSQAWYRTFVSAIQHGKLKFVPDERRPELIALQRQNPGRDTKVTREEFKRFAGSIGQDPTFLRDK